MRVERDSMGEVEIPDDALWGAQTQRAEENFPISGRRFSRNFIRALGQVKKACCQANLELGLIEEEKAQAILQASDEVIAGKWDEHFPLDIFQTGSGTSTNMNANEVIANRAIQLMGGEIGSRSPVHPNDNVNLSQSSNDVIPTTIHIALILAVHENLLPALSKLEHSLQKKETAFADIVKTGRTHLQDATPIRLGQEFGGYAAQTAKSIQKAQQAIDLLREIPLGGTAVGTGLNRPRDFPATAIEFLNKNLDIQFEETDNHIEANAARDDLVAVSGLIKTIAVSMTKIANDIRWMGSGPRSGLGELDLPVVQPGSSIMPGKNNPVIAESLIQVAAYVIGSDQIVTQAGLGGYFELNLMMPLMSHSLMTSVVWLSRAVENFSERCVMGIEANRDKMAQDIENNLSLVTALAPVIGYDQAAKISKEAFRSGRTIREVAEEMTGLSSQTLDDALDPGGMTEPDEA